MSKKIDELRNLRADEIDAGKSITAKAKEEDRDLTDAELEQVNAHVAKSKELAEQIQAEEAKEKARLDALTALDSEDDDASRPETVPVKPQFESGAKDGLVRQTGGQGSSKFRGFGEFLHMVRGAATQPDIAGDLQRKLMATAGPSGLNTVVDSEGAFLVPPEFSNSILQKMYSSGQILSRVRKIGLSTSNELKIPFVNESSRADGSRWGGVQGYWVEEGNEPTKSKPDYGQLSLRLKKCGCVGYVTDELMADSEVAGTLLEQAFADELRFKVENAIFQGTGAGQPLGILNAACTVEVSAETNQTAATIWGPNVTKMEAQLFPRSIPNAVFLVNQSTLPYIRGLTIEGRYGSASTSAEGIPIYMPPQGPIREGNYGTLLGYPILPVEYTKAVGTAGDIVLADLSQYMLIDKSGIKADASIHVRFVYGETTFRAFYRVDGAPWWSSALTPFDGGSTLSPFVKLAARG